MKKVIFLFGILMVSILSVYSQAIWKMTYDVAVPLSASKEYTDHFSWRGISMDGDRLLDDNLAVGFGFSWQVFVEKEVDAMIEIDGANVHGTQVRYINSIPLLARVSYYKEMDMFEPYFTAGIGTVWQERRTDIGTWAITETAWHFALAPEVGVIIPAGPTYLTLKVKYMHGFQTQSADNLSYLSFGLGVAW
jgi:opacity protein-like surface antigen